jgi:hypothetical protein
MLVMGASRVAPNPSNEVDIYDPGTNAWTTGSPVPAFTTARRNFPTDTDGTTRIWMSGGYDSSGTPVDSMEILTCPVSPGAIGTAIPRTGKAKSSVEGRDPGGFSPTDVPSQAIPDAARQAMLNLKVQMLQAIVPQQQQQIETLTAQVREQVAQIQKMSAQLEMSKAATKAIVNKP